jgi:hypothetical protein
LDINSPGDAALEFCFQFVNVRERPGHDSRRGAACDSEACQPQYQYTDQKS